MCGGVRRRHRLTSGHALRGPSACQYFSGNQRPDCLRGTDVGFRCLTGFYAFAVVCRPFGMDAAKVSATESAVMPLVRIFNGIMAARMLGLFAHVHIWHV